MKEKFDLREKAFNKALEGHSLILTGQCGTGKMHTTNIHKQLPLNDTVFLMSKISRKKSSIAWVVYIRTIFVYTIKIYIDRFCAYIYFGFENVIF